MRKVALVSIAALATVLSGCDIFDEMAVASLIERLNEEASAENAKVRIPFDPASETIITESAPYLVRDYRLNYAQRKEDTSDTGRNNFESFRMVRYPGCTRARPDGDFSYILDPSATPGLCALHIFAEKPPASALTTEWKWRDVEVDGYTIARAELTIRRPGGRKATLIFYPGRDELGFMAAPQIASALGLAPRGSDVAGTLGPAEVDELIEGATARSGGVKYAWLDELAQRDPASDQNLYPSSFAAAEIGRRAESLIRRFEAKASQADITGYWRFIGDLLARLPQDDWVQYRDRIAAAMLRAPREQVLEQKKLILRMADMGSAAGPVMARATSDGFVHYEIALAACRAGAPVAPHMGEALLASWKTSNSPQLVGFEERRRWRNSGWRRGVYRELRREEWKRCTEEGKKHGPPANIAFSACWAIPKTTSEASPTYLALRRMGLGGEADALMRHQYSRHWKKTYGSIGPASPAEVCGESSEL